MPKVVSLLAVQNKIVLKMDDPEKKKGSIMLPDEAQGQQRRGVVVAVGPGKWTTSSTTGTSVACMGVALGDVVHVQDYHGGKVTTKRALADQAGKEWPAGTEFLVCDEDDVLMVER